MIIYKRVFSFHYATTINRGDLTRVRSFLGFSSMGACISKPTPTCGEINPKTKLFCTCCRGQVIIDRSNVDGAYGSDHAVDDTDEQKGKERDVE